MNSVMLNSVKYTIGLIILIPLTFMLFVAVLFYLIHGELATMSDQIESINDVWKPYKRS